MKKGVRNCCFTVLCLLCACLLGGCMPDYSDGSEENYAYGVYWLYQGEGETAPDEYYIGTDSKIYCFSVSSGELATVMEYPGYKPQSKDEGSRITKYAVREDAVWFATEDNDDGPGLERKKLWKYDRATGVCELFLEAEKGTEIWRLGEHDGWLFYGGRKIYACPVDGTPGEDSFNVWDQREGNLRENEGWPPLYIDECQSWYMGYCSKQLIYVQDKESGEVPLSIDDDFMSQSFGPGVCVNGELIFFPIYHPWHVYMRDDGQGSRRIECLEDDQYSAAGIAGRHVVAEEGKLIVLLQVTRNDWSWLMPDQDELNNDVLVEIDLTTNTDRLLYATKDKNTRIIGCRRGVLYLLEDDVIYRESPEGGDREQFYDLRDSKVELYDRFGEHRDVRLTMWGDYLIVESGVVDEITRIPLKDGEDYVISEADR